MHASFVYYPDRTCLCFRSNCQMQPQKCVVVVVVVVVLVAKCVVAALCLNDNLMVEPSRLTHGRIDIKVCTFWNNYLFPLPF